MDCLPIETCALLLAWFIAILLLLFTDYTSKICCPINPLLLNSLLHSIVLPFTVVPY